MWRYGKFVHIVHAFEMFPYTTNLLIVRYKNYKPNKLLVTYYELRIIIMSLGLYTPESDVINFVENWESVCCSLYSVANACIRSH